MSIDGVVLTVLAVLVGLVVGFLRRGRLARVGHAPVRAKTLLLLGVVIPALADRFTREVAVPLVVFALAALFVFALANVRLVGMSVMAVGILANLLATFLNHGMPVRQDALVAAGLATSEEVARVELDGARRLEEPTHRLRILGDIIPLEETGQVLSFGDLVILVGLADITANLTLRRRRRAAEEPDEDELPAEALDEIQRLLHARRPAAGSARNPRPAPRHGAVAVLDDGLGAVVLDAPTFAPDLDWFAPYPPRGTFWLDALDESAVEVALDPAPPPALAAPPAPEEPPAPVLEEPPAVLVEEPVVVEEPPAPVREEIPVEIPVLEERPVLEETPAVVDLCGSAPVLELPEPVEPEPDPAPVATPTAPDDDDVLAGLFRDLGKKRTRRRGTRNIPDFEPVHVDDGFTPSRR